MVVSSEEMRFLRSIAFSQGRGIQFVRPLPLEKVPAEVWEEPSNSGIAWWRESAPIFGQSFDRNFKNGIDCPHLRRRFFRGLSYSIDGVVFPTFKRAGTPFIPSSIWQGHFLPSSASGHHSRPVLMTSKHLSLVTGYLEHTLQAAPYDGECYMGLVSLSVLQILNQESGFENWRRYLEPGTPFYAGETGKLGKSRLISVAHQGHLGCGEMIVFGDDPMGMLEGKAPTLTSLPQMHDQPHFWKWMGLLGFSELVSASLDRSPVVFVPSGLQN
ncbi:MAG: hypothetical protein KC643_31560 [Nitrospira sp.]|nr:hypothetical protein [Nitrospira sp.]